MDDRLASANTKTPSSSINEVFTILATKLWIIAASLITQSILARVLQPEGRGAYAVCIMFATILPVLFTPGADRGAQYCVLRKEFTLSVGVGVGVGIALAGSLLAFVIAQPLISSSLEFFSKADTNSFQFSLLIMPLSILDTVLKLQLAGLRRFSHLGFFAIFESATYVAGIGLFVWYLKGDVEGAILSMAIGYCISISLSLTDLVRNCGLRIERVRFRQIFTAIDYGRKYYIARIGNMSDFHIGSLTLAFLASKLEIGLFVAASALVMRVFIISVSIESSLLPRVMADSHGGPDLVGQCARLSGMITGTILLVLVAVSRPLIEFLLSASFLPSTPIIYVLAPGIAVYAGSKVILTYFQGIGRPEICSYTLLLGMPVTALLTVLLYPSVGMVAAALAMTASFLIRSLFLVVAFKMISGQGYLTLLLPRLDDWTPLLRIIRNRFG